MAGPSPRKRYHLFIDGQWRKGPTTREILFPYDGRLVGRVCLAGPAEMDAAIAAAEAAFPLTRELPTHRRSAILEASGTESETGLTNWSPQCVWSRENP